MPHPRLCHCACLLTFPIAPLLRSPLGVNPELLPAGVVLVGDPAGQRGSCHVPPVPWDTHCSWASVPSPIAQLFPRSIMSELLGVHLAPAVGAARGVGCASSRDWLPSSHVNLLSLSPHYYPLCCHV